MSVQTEIDRIITAVGAAYDAVETKGGTLPASETVANLAEAISSIPKDTHQAVEQATPSLSLNAATGVVTAEATQAAGLVAAGTKKATMQLATQAAKTVTPSAAQQTAVASGKYTTGDVVVAAVPTEAKTVELSMPSGDQTVSPDAGKFLSAVTVKKPATMLPENIKKGVSIGGVVGTLESGGGGSGGDIDALIERTIQEITSNASKVGNYAFTGCAALTTASFPQATSIGEQAFRLCGSLATIEFPLVTIIDANAFQNCTALTTATFPQVASIGDSAFSGCRALTTARFSKAKGFGSYAFQNCSALTTVESPQATRIRQSAFSDCKLLANVEFPLVTIIDASAFKNCSALTTVGVPEATNIGGSTFNGCSSLTTVSLPKAENIGIQAFYGCGSLTALVLESETVCKLGSNAFFGTPIASKKGYIYVPDDRVNTYKIATNWKTYASQIKPLSEYSA